MERLRAELTLANGSSGLPLALKRVHHCVYAVVWAGESNPDAGVRLERLGRAIGATLSAGPVLRVSWVKHGRRFLSNGSMSVC